MRKYLILGSLFFAVVVCASIPAFVLLEPCHSLSVIPTSTKERADAALSAEQSNKQNYKNLILYNGTSGVIVCVGDSITKGNADPDNWPYQLGALLKVKVINQGANGETTRNMLDRINNATAPRPEYVIIAGGINDLNALVPASIIESNIATMCQRVQSQHSAPVLCTVTPETIPHFQRPDALNAWIKNYAIEHKYPLIDFYSVVDSNRTYLSSDGIHPSSAGYTAMANAAAKVLTANETETKRR